MRAATRHVLGEPCTATALLAALEAGPLGLRRGWAFALAIRSGGRAWLNTRAPSAEQRNVLADARPGDSARAGAGLARGG